MPQIIPETTFGSSLGQNIGQGLGKLVSKKVEQLEQRHGLQKLGFPKEMAANISKLPPKIQEQVIGNFIQSGQNQEFAKLLGGITGQSDTPYDNNPTAADTLNGLSLPSTQEQQPGISRELQQAAQPNQQADDQTKIAQIISSLDAGKKQQPKSVLQTLMSPKLTPERQIQLASLKMKQQDIQRKERSELRKISIDEQREINKETLPYYNEINKKYKTAKEDQRRLARMEELVRNGKLDTPLFSSLMDTTAKGIFGFGINLDSFRSPDSQEFKKLSTEFLKGAKNLFGARVTDNEIKMFMQMVPTLMQSDRGKLRVINNMKVYNMAEILHKQAMDKIIEENNGIRPRNLDMLVDKAVGPQLDKLAQEFSKGFNIKAEPEKEKSSLSEKLKVRLAPVSVNPVDLFTKISNWLGD